MGMADITNGAELLRESEGKVRSWETTRAYLRPGLSSLRLAHLPSPQQMFLSRILPAALYLLESL